MLRHLADRGARARAGASAQPLSARGTGIDRAIARGRTNQEIADELFISLSTVKGYVPGILIRLGVRNRVGIAAWAWESRLMDGESGCGMGVGVTRARDVDLRCVRAGGIGCWSSSHPA
ncbi:response regulator transcription factor [Nonomuraea roseola]|uniref:Response regulator transcription factor n=1 Tax=Nonomuraea roseola TaxID=46179 RepID=A0ABV5QDY9_9ACTN